MGHNGGRAGAPARNGATARNGAAARRTSGPARFALVLFGVAVGYLVGRRVRSAAPSGSGGTDRLGGTSRPAGRSGSDSSDRPGGTSRPTGSGGLGRFGEVPRGPAAGGGTTSVGPLTRATDDQPTGSADDDRFTADTVSGPSATTASHPYEVPSGQTTAKPAAPVGNPVVPAGDAADDGPPPLRRRPDQPTRGDRPDQPARGDRPDQPAPAGEDRSAVPARGDRPE